ncbi:pterin 4 alpha carbinolamine dehydratase-domain-containing protein [Chytriomyces sp. MP71]|nr:pterin 4 alpha carbinolamine dehydratase-domain-containing protein [Chytriomyces sp. MP71]
MIRTRFVPSLRWSIRRLISTSLPARMPALTRLSALQRETLVQPLLASGWTLNSDPIAKRESITRSFTFPSFSEAFAFMTRVAIAAEKADHHPEWENVYNRVRVELTTHDAGNSVSEKDIHLASLMNEFAKGLEGK